MGIRDGWMDIFELGIYERFQRTHILTLGYGGHSTTGHAQRYDITGQSCAVGTKSSSEA